MWIEVLVMTSMPLVIRHRLLDCGGLGLEMVTIRILGRSGPGAPYDMRWVVLTGMGLRSSSSSFSYLLALYYYTTLLT